MVVLLGILKMRGFSVNYAFNSELILERIQNGEKIRVYYFLKENWTKFIEYDYTGEKSHLKIKFLDKILIERLLVKLNKHCYNLY